MNDSLNIILDSTDIILKKDYQKYSEIEKNAYNISKCFMINAVCSLAVSTVVHAHMYIAKDIYNSKDILVSAAVGVSLLAGSAIANSIAKYSYSKKEKIFDELIIK